MSSKSMAHSPLSHASTQFDGQDCSCQRLPHSSDTHPPAGRSTRVEHLSCKRTLKIILGTKTKMPLAEIS